MIHANEKVDNLKDMVALASGPLVYCFENNLNDGIDALEIDSSTVGHLNYEVSLLNGVNTITGKTTSGHFYKAIPYYAVGNVRPGDRYKV